MLGVSESKSYQANTIDVVVDEFGFLKNPEQWTEAFAEDVLGLLPGEMTSSHLNVIHFVRHRFLNLGALPPLRHVCKSTGLEKVEMKALFGSCIQLWRAAGLPRPDDEIRSHMN